MLLKIFKKLDNWIQDEKEEAISSSGRIISDCQFKVLGQFALLEADLALSIAATADLDAYSNASYAVVKQLDILLSEYGMHYDPMSSEIWMPKETKYDQLYQGVALSAYIARPEYVLLSKALKAPERNIALLIQYLASGPSSLFLELCETYSVDLEALVEK